MAWAPQYAVTADLAAYERIEDFDDNTQLDLACTAASRAVDRACNRQFGLVASAEARTYSTRWDRRFGYYVVEHDDLMTTTGLAIVDDNGTAISTSDITKYPRNADKVGRPWEYFTVATATPEVTVTAKWGWTSVPNAIGQATLIQASRFFKRRESPFGVAGSPDLGSELRLLAKVDPDVAVILGPYYRWWAGA